MTPCVTAGYPYLLVVGKEVSNMLRYINHFLNSEPSILEAVLVTLAILLFDLWIR